MKTAVLIAAMAIVTMLIRFLPFLVIRKETPKEAMTILRRLTGCRFKLLDNNNILITK